MPACLVAMLPCPALFWPVLAQSHAAVPLWMAGDLVAQRWADRWAAWVASVVDGVSQYVEIQIQVCLYVLQGDCVVWYTLSPSERYGRPIIPFPYRLAKMDGVVPGSAIM